MAILLNWLSGLALSDVADALSVLGALGTLWVALQVRKLKKFYLRRVRLPELVSKFEELTSEISTNLGAFDRNAEAIKETMSTMLGLVRAIRGKLEWSERSRVSLLTGLLEKATRSSEPTEAEVRSVYRACLQSIELLVDLNEDMTWVQ